MTETEAPAPPSARSLVIIVPFLIMIALPGLHLLVRRSAPTASQLENRVLAPRPERPETLADLPKFATAADAYFADHLGFRHELTRVYSFLVHRLGDSASPYVELGRDGWLFLRGRRYGDPFGDARHLNRYDEKSLQRHARVLELRRQFLESRGVRYLYVVAPNTHTIYREKLPDWATVEHDASALDQLYAELAGATRVSAPDLRPALLEAKPRLAVYHRTDSHWNDYGASVAQEIIGQALASMFPGEFTVRHFTPDDFEPRPYSDGDLAKLMCLEDWIEDRQPFLREGRVHDCSRQPLSKGDYITRCEGSRRRALVLCDSFFINLEPYVSQYFDEAVYIWGDVGHRRLAELVRRFDPDVVIEEHVERHLPENVPKLDKALVEAVRNVSSPSE